MPAEPRTVLLVEDNDDNRHLYQAMFEYEGLRVLTAPDGSSGVDLALTEAPDLILMDLAMPVMNGIEATRLLKADDRTRHIPVLALSAHVLPLEQEEALEAGCAAFLAKPISPREVLAAVLRWLDRGGG